MEKTMNQATIALAKELAIKYKIRITDFKLRIALSKILDKSINFITFIDNFMQYKKSYGQTKNNLNEVLSDDFLQAIENLNNEQFDLFKKIFNIYLMTY